MGVSKIYRPRVSNDLAMPLRPEQTLSLTVFVHFCEKKREWDFILDKVETDTWKVYRFSSIIICGEIHISLTFYLFFRC